MMLISIPPEFEPHDHPPHPDEAAAAAALAVHERSCEECIEHERLERMSSVGSGEDPECEEWWRLWDGMTDAMGRRRAAAERIARRAWEDSIAAKAAAFVERHGCVAPGGSVEEVARRIRAGEWRACR